MDRYAHFWASIRSLTAEDTSVEVPKEVRKGALALFQPRKKERLNRIFLPASLAANAVRKAHQQRKFLFELDAHVLQLEQNNGESGCRMNGFVHGLADGPVTLYGDECVFEAQIENGTFSFDSVPFGSYNLCLTQDGGPYWVKNLQLEREEPA